MSFDAPAARTVRGVYVCMCVCVCVCVCVSVCVCSSAAAARTSQIGRVRAVTPKGFSFRGLV